MLVHGNIRDLRRETLRMIDFKSHYMLHEDLKNYVLKEASDFTAEELDYPGPKGHFIEQLKVLIRINIAVDLCVKIFVDKTFDKVLDITGSTQLFENYKSTMESFDYIIKECINKGDQIIPELDSTKDFFEILKEHQHKRKHGHFSSGLGEDITNKIFRYYIKDNGKYIIPMFLIGSKSLKSIIVSREESSYLLYKNSYDSESIVRELIKTNTINSNKFDEYQDYTIDLENSTPIEKENQLTIDDVIKKSNTDIYTASHYYDYLYNNTGKYPIDIDPLGKRDFEKLCIPHQARWIAEIAKHRCSVIDGVDVSENPEEIRIQAEISQSKISDFDWLNSPFTMIFTYILHPDLSKLFTLTEYSYIMIANYKFMVDPIDEIVLPKDIILINNKRVIKSVRKFFDKRRVIKSSKFINKSIDYNLSDLFMSDEYQNEMMEINDEEREYIETCEKFAQETKKKMDGQSLRETIFNGTNALHRYPGIWFDEKLYSIDNFPKGYIKSFDLLNEQVKKINDERKYHRQFDITQYQLSKAHTDVVNTTSFVNFRMLFNSLMICSLTGNMKDHLKVSWSNIKLSDIPGRWWLPENCMQETIPEFALPSLVETRLIYETEELMEYENKTYDNYTPHNILKKIISTNGEMPELRNIGLYKCKTPMKRDRLEYYIKISKITELVGLNYRDGDLFTLRMNRRIPNRKSVLDVRRFGYDIHKKYLKPSRYIYKISKSNIAQHQGLTHTMFLKGVSEL